MPANLEDARNGGYVGVARMGDWISATALKAECWRCAKGIFAHKEQRFRVADGLPKKYKQEGLQDR